MDNKISFEDTSDTFQIFIILLYYIKESRSSFKNNLIDNRRAQYNYLEQNFRII